MMINESNYLAGVNNICQSSSHCLSLPKSLCSAAVSAVLDLYLEVPETVISKQECFKTLLRQATSLISFSNNMNIFDKVRM